MSSYLAACVSGSAFAQENQAPALLLHAARVFDGTDMRTNTSVLVVDGKVERIGPREAFTGNDATVVDLGDATLLPGLIELHAHLGYRHVPADVVLRHGITTLRDVGGPLHPPTGGDGSLRVLSSGLILTAPEGYPIPGMGAENIATPVAGEEEARATVRRMIEGGAVTIKVALEPGGEHGAPWSAGHGHAHAHGGTAGHGRKAWPLLPENIVKAIVEEAHRSGRKVAAHLAEPRGVKLALQAGIDEWAHMPCEPIPETLLKQAVAQGVKIVGTLDTLSHCAGIAQNARAWTALGGELLYGAEIAHPDVPWGIDAEELVSMASLADMRPIDVLRAATSKAGRHLNIPLLGTLTPGAPADIVAVKGDPTHNFKALEYPDLVVSGGKILLNNLANPSLPGDGQRLASAPEGERRECAANATVLAGTVSDRAVAVASNPAKAGQ